MIGYPFMLSEHQLGSYAFRESILATCIYSCFKHTTVVLPKKKKHLTPVSASWGVKVNFSVDGNFSGVHMGKRFTVCFGDCKSWWQEKKCRLKDAGRRVGLLAAGGREAAASKMHVHTQTWQPKSAIDPLKAPTIAASAPGHPVSPICTCIIIY